MKKSDTTTELCSGIQGIGGGANQQAFAKSITFALLATLSRIRDNSCYPEKNIISKSRRKALQRKTSLMVFPG